MSFIVDVAEIGWGYSRMLFKCKGKVIGIMVPYHSRNLSRLNSRCFQKIPGFFNSFFYYILIASFLHHSFKQSRKVIRGYKKLVRQIPYRNLYPTPTSVMMYCGSDGFFSIFLRRVAMNTRKVPASTPSAYPQISLRM